MISAIVLAAGLSTRMGSLKQLLPYGDRSVIEQVVATLATCPVDDILVVLGHRHTEIAAAIEKAQARTTVNPRYKEEMLTSIQHGWRTVNPGTNAVLHVLGDQPHLDPRVVRQLVAAYQQERAGIFVPTYANRRGHPILLDARYGEEILALAAPRTMHDFMRAHAADIRHLPAASDAILRDMDTPDEYEREIKLKFPAPAATPPNRS